MFRSSNFEKNLENATSHLHLEPDWPSILLICDAIRQNDVTAKQAFLAIKKKMTSPNPHTAFYALLVLESVVKNCGTPMHEEISIKENCEMFSGFIEQTPHENVRAKMLELIQTWAYAFRTSEKYQAIKDTMTILKTKGHIFPELKEADAMFTADTAPDWADGKVCHRCRVEFSFTQRKHHCRNCGQIFCAQCSSKQCPLPKFGIEKDVRVCDGCFIHLQKPSSGKTRTGENDLPAEYLSSSLAQQAQIPQRKTEQELKEEEELQLALALSQSEAEQKNKVNINYRILQSSPSSEALPSTITNHAPIEETPTDPELAKYLNRSYWEQRKTTESPASPSAPSPMPLVNNVVINNKNVWEDNEVDEFSNNMKSQVEIFVNRMKSNSSRGRNISNDSSVQTLFMNLTSLHSQLLTYIKDMDDKRMWYEQLQDKLAQVKDSRAALDVLRQEHIEKLRSFAEEQERQRQLQMAHKLEIMRKKKQEYLQYQRQLALQRIQEQEREMQMRQEQQKAQYRMGQNAFPFIPGQGSPNHQMAPTYTAYGYNPNSILPRFGQQGQMITSQSQPGMPAVPMPGMYAPVISPLPIHPNMIVAGSVSNMPNQSQSLPPVSLPSQSQMSTIPGSAQMPVHQIPLNVPDSNAPIVSHPKMIQSTVPPGIISGQAYLPNVVGISTNAGLPNTQTLPGISQIVHNNQTSLISQSQQQQQQPNSIPMAIQNSPGGQMPPIMQTAPSVSNNEIQQNAVINSASKQVEQEPNEVSTAELISFD